MSKLYFEHGPMGSQKSTKLLVTAHNYKEHGGAVLVTKPAVDVKGDDRIVSRIDGLSLRVDFLTTPGLDVRAEVLRRQQMGGRAISAVLVDEAQFLEPGQVDQLFGLVVSDDIPVMAWGLRTDFKTHAFPGSARLLELAQEIRVAIAMCGNGDGCKSRAEFNARKVDGLYVAEGGQVAIDGIAKVTYASLCARHYIEQVGPVAALEASQ